MPTPKIFRKDRLQRRRVAISRSLRWSCILGLVLALAAPLPVTQATSEVASKVMGRVVASVFRHIMASQNAASPQSSAQASRISLLIGETQTISLTMQLKSILVVSPEIASASLSGASLTIVGLHVGETMLIGFDGQTRFIFIIEVVGRTYATTHQNIAPADAAAFGPGSLSGSYELTYSAPFGGTSSLIRQTFEFQKKLSNRRTLRFSSDTFKFIGQGNRDSLRRSAAGLGISRISLGIDGPDGSVDVLDSNVNISPLTFSGSQIRGFHFVSTLASRYKGTEFFAGQARPSNSLFDVNHGRVMGLVVPVAQGEFWRVRAGLLVTSPGKDTKLGHGGTVWHLDGRYAPSEKLVADGEVAYANGGLSWRARVDLVRGPFTVYGELMRLDRRSPLISVGVQGGGRQTEALNLQWRANARLNSSFSFNHSAIEPSAGSGRAALNHTNLLGSANFRINQQSRLDFHFSRQQIEVVAPEGTAIFRLETRTAAVSYDLRVNQSWTNHLQVRLNSTRETRADAAIDRGFSFSEQLRYSFKGGSAVGFLDYTNQQSSLAGFLVRNPTLLPTSLQPAFAADPARFLQTNRDVLGLLIPGVELPQTRGLEMGIRLQKAFARVNLAAEARYSANEILGHEQRSMITSASMNLQLDAANSFQISGSRSFGGPGAIGQSTLTVSYVHRFGAGSGGGFQFSRLLGLDRGRIKGRVFFDLNGNGRDDANEPGIAAMKVQLDGDRTVITDQSGCFSFDANSGPYHLNFVSEDLGLRWRATTMTEQHGLLNARETVNVSFGVNNYGSVAGRIFIDELQKGERTAGSLPGVTDVRLTLRGSSIVSDASMTVDGNGSYLFRNVAPGTYTLAMDVSTMPADFRLPEQTSWVVVVEPLQSLYVDIPLFAQRAISGVVFVDKDGDGRYDPAKDQPVAGAMVFAGNSKATSGKDGAYVIRNLPAGKLAVYATVANELGSHPITILLSSEPTRSTGINLAVRP
jgi:hypothetical protein